MMMFRWKLMSYTSLPLFCHSQKKSIIMLLKMRIKVHGIYRRKFTRGSTHLKSIFLGRLNPMSAQFATFRRMQVLSGVARIRCSSFLRGKRAGALQADAGHLPSPNGNPNSLRARVTQQKHFIRCYSSSILPSLSSSPFVSPGSPVLVDLSQYLLNGCDWRKAPKCPDYVGPLTISRTPDGRGRGLYATEDVPAGNVLLISNAFAASYNDCHSIDLYTKIASILKESPRALHQYYSLAGYEYHDEMDVPDIRLFDPNVPYTVSGTTEVLELDEKRTVHILNVNSFEGELTAPRNEEEVKLNGLWLLPSFINHCCSPNASRLVVGEAMLIMASQDIKAKEEITIGYTDCMSPLEKREQVLESMGYGFRCQCKRCIVERSVQEQLQDISEHYHALYDKASEEVYSVATTREKRAYPACRELAGIFDSLKTRVASLESVTKLQKQWILGGYSSAFLGNWLTIGYSTDFAWSPDLVSPTALELVEAMKATVPGMLRTLSFATILATVMEKQQKSFVSVHRLFQLAMDECIRVYGKQRPDVTLKLMEQSVDIVPFF